MVLSDIELTSCLVCMTTPPATSFVEFGGASSLDASSNGLFVICGKVIVPLSNQTVLKIKQLLFKML